MCVCARVSVYHFSSPPFSSHVLKWGLCGINHYNLDITKGDMTSFQSGTFGSRQFRTGSGILGGQHPQEFPRYFLLSYISLYEVIIFLNRVILFDCPEAGDESWSPRRPIPLERNYLAHVAERLTSHRVITAHLPVRALSRTTNAELVLI